MVSRVETGVPGLDHVLGGGIPHGYSWLVEGENGLGKTTLGLQFVQAIAMRPEERAVYVTFVEQPQELYRFAQNFGWDLQGLESGGRLRMLATSPEVFLKELLDGGGTVRELLDSFMPTRLVIDAVTDLRLRADTMATFRLMIEGLTNIFRRRRVTTLLIEDFGADVPPSGLLRRVADITTMLQWNVLESGSGLDRVIQVNKVRGQAHYTSPVLFEIGPKGLVVIPPDYEAFPREPIESISQLPPSAGVHGFSTGLEGLDRLTGGGLPFETNWLLLFDANSYFPDPYLPAIAQALADGASLFNLPSSRESFSSIPRLFLRYGFNMQTLVGEGRILIADLLERRVPEGIQASVLSARQGEAFEVFLPRLVERYHALGESDHKRPGLSVIYANLILRRYGPESFRAFIDQFLARNMRPHSVTLLVANCSELGADEIGFLSFYARGIIRFWKTDGYQYLQVTKTPRNSSSPPAILVRSPHYPFFELIARR